VPNAKNRLSATPSAASVLMRVARVNSSHQERGGRAGDERAGQDRFELPRAGHEEAEADAGERRVAERVAQEALLAQDGEAAQHAGDESDERGAERDGADGEVTQQRDEFHAHAPGLWGSDGGGDALPNTTTRGPYAARRFSAV
jgi:hypothetical protein